MLNTIITYWALWKWFERSVALQNIQCSLP